MDEIRRLTTNGIDASFLSNAEKAAMYSAFQKEWAKWDAGHR
jgi:adenosine deaminase